MVVTLFLSTAWEFLQVKGTIHQYTNDPKWTCDLCFTHHTKPCTVVAATKEIEFGT